MWEIIVTITENQLLWVFINNGKSGVHNNKGFIVIQYPFFSQVFSFSVCWNITVVINFKKAF